MNSTRMTGGEAIVAGLLDHGIDTVYGLPGAQIYGVFDALHRAQPKLKVIGARHEQACGYMAFGHARSTGRPSVFSVVPGPGILNAGAAMLTAFGCNTPVLCVTGQVPSHFLGKGRGHLHEMPDQLATLRTFVKWADRIDGAAMARVQVARAFQAMLSGRPGPAALEMPWDVFTNCEAIADCAPLTLLPAPPADPEAVAAAASLIAQSTRPMILVGGGAIDAAADIENLAEMLDAPVVGFRSGRGIVSNAHPLGLTLAEGYELWSETDLVIAVGTRLELVDMRWQSQPAGQKVIRIDIDAAETRRFLADVNIIADATQAVGALAQAVGPAGFRRRPERRAEIKLARAKVEEDIRAIEPQMSYLRVLRELLPANAFVTDELSQVGFASWYGFPVYEPRSFVSSGYQGTLGSGYPTALGVKVANPDRPVVAICGDGGFMFAVQELATAVQFDIGVIALVFNNEAYGNVRRDQVTRFGGRVIGSDLVNPDFMKIADAFGVGGASVTSPDGFRTALERALAAGGPWLIEIKIPRDSEASPWRFIHRAGAVKMAPEPKQQ
jgi:acetolactate synthase-1/2/3 large subunit